MNPLAAYALTGLVFGALLTVVGVAGAVEQAHRCREEKELNRWSQ